MRIALNFVIGIMVCHFHMHALTIRYLIGVFSTHIQKREQINKECESSHHIYESELVEKLPSFSTRNPGVRMVSGISVIYVDIVITDVH